MKKVHAWWVLVKLDFNALANSATVKDDEAKLKAEFMAMLPELFSELEQTLAKILLQAL